ncbi:hypothetical protein GYMLUDRAFT_62549 [Collybiopsis luxurians FD-317 M1]|uniref:Peptidase A2 domain-containing protein n=1 Tax=Collybiopsis luxurians FD-317 M1 TaxID=944289 RepID=A0A0D0BL04_9AGAR|nr:hypothetical protein GYMLUDRAFT_62549 [Collybiopsis luxurians FD-317 M1]
MQAHTPQGPSFLARQFQSDQVDPPVKIEPIEPSLTANFFSMEGSLEICLPVYSAMILGHYNHALQCKASKMVNIIADTGAQDNYVWSNVIHLINANIFPLDQPCEVAGTGHTVTQAFACFTLKIGPIEETIVAYVLDQSMGFHYDLLLGYTFLARHGIVFNWDNNTLDFVSPKTRASVTIQAI